MMTSNSTLPGEIYAGLYIAKDAAYRGGTKQPGANMFQWQWMTFFFFFFPFLENS